jgi:hypothetical protein
MTILTIFSTALVPSIMMGCGLTFSVADEYGVSVPYIVERFVAQNGIDYTASFRDLSAKQLPCGNYSYTLGRADVKSSFGKISGSVLVVERWQWALVKPDTTLVITSEGVLAIDRARPKDYLFRGHVRGLDRQNGPAHVRLYELFGSQFYDVEVEPDGTFAFSRQVEGKCLLVVLHGGDVRATALLNVKPGRTPSSFEIAASQAYPFRSIE